MPVFQALADLGIHAEPAVYHDDFCDDVRRQLDNVDGVLVWVNPIEGGCNRFRDLSQKLWCWSCQP